VNEMATVCAASVYR